MLNYVVCDYNSVKLLKQWNLLTVIHRLILKEIWDEVHHSTYLCKPLRHIISEYVIPIIQINPHGYTMDQALYYCPLFKNKKFHAQKAPPTLQKETSSLGKAESGTWVLWFSIPWCSHHDKCPALVLLTQGCEGRGWGSLPIYVWLEGKYTIVSISEWTFLWFSGHLMAISMLLWASTRHGFKH